MRSFNSDDKGELLLSILQQTSSEVLVFDADTHKIVQANLAIKRNLQYRLRALQKLTPLDLMSPQDGRSAGVLLALLKNGQKRQVSLRLHFHRHDGSRYPAEVRLLYANDRAQPVFICIANDISLREATRQALEHSASDLRAIVAHIPGMAFQVMQQGDAPPTLRYVSEQSEQLLGIKAAALQAKPERFFRLILKEDRGSYLDRLAASGGVHLSFNWVGRLWMKDWKDVKWVAIRVSQRSSADQTVWDGIMLNVTHSKEAEAELLRSRAQLSALAAHVETVKEQERLKLAREVHDDLGGNLTAIKIGLSWLMQQLPPGEKTLAERVAYLDSVVDQTFEAAHRIASNLRPAALDLGIVAALDWQLQRFAHNTHIATHFSAPDAPVPLDADAATAIFRIVQEALTNVARHAHATQVKLKLAREPGRLLLTLTDNGRGMPPAGKERRRPGFGLLGMRERIVTLGGELSVQPAEHGGTRVSLSIPLPAAASAPAK